MKTHGGRKGGGGLCGNSMGIGGLSVQTRGGGGGGDEVECVETHGTGKALYWLGFQASPLPARSAAQWLTNDAVTSASQVLGSMAVSLFLHTSTTVCFSGVSERFPPRLHSYIIVLR